MKIQDSIFIAVLVVLLVLRKPKYVTVAGLVGLALSIPLFALWVFFTAERLVWYAAAFFFLSIVFSLLESRKVQ